MAKEAGFRNESVDVGDRSQGDSSRDGEWRKGETRLIWEKPLGTKRGYLDEPGPRFVDVEGEADKEATRWERGTSNAD